MQTNNNFLKFLAKIILVLLISSLLFFSCTHTPETKQPNVLLIVADDLGYGDLSCYGSNDIETPNIDALADNGIKLGNFYAGSAVCTPSRVAMLTGKFPIRYNVTKHFSDVTNENLPVTEDNIPHMFRNNGYASAHVGKWHLGGLQEHEFTARQHNGQRIDPGPLQHGFDHYLAFIEDTIRGILHNEKMLYRKGVNE
ncbi:MAG: sulfatase-like hydrolase/transferase [Bacteroidetes bacterium]|jgi:arylsulfatase A-like enzyme|nr:sulfatase-like hydrolase/transferase [Bacteroidota bacterium]